MWIGVGIQLVHSHPGGSGQVGTPADAVREVAQLQGERRRLVLVRQVQQMQLHVLGGEAHLKLHRAGRQLEGPHHVRWWRPQVVVLDRLEQRELIGRHAQLGLSAGIDSYLTLRDAVLESPAGQQWVEHVELHPWHSPHGARDDLLAHPDALRIVHRVRLVLGARRTKNHILERDGGAGASGR
eukprot:scaffold9726_cov119-Isochrysis_galbana.AAC.34